MKLSRVERGYARVIGAFVFAGLLCAIPSIMAQDPAQSQPTDSELREAWHASMSRAPLPKKGCFKASYPSTEWQQVPCVAAPSNPLLRSSGRQGNPNTVGSTSDDFVAKVSGLISRAEGSFLSVTPGITETGTNPNTGETTPNAFTLQLNSNTFTTPACKNGGAHCSGWQ